MRVLDKANRSIHVHKVKNVSVGPAPKNKFTCPYCLLGLVSTLIILENLFRNTYIWVTPCENTPESIQLN